MKDWWQNLSEREQLLVGGGGTALLIVILYLFVWSPFTDSISTKKSYVTYQQNLAGWMQQADNRLSQLRGSGEQVQKINSGELLNTVDDTLRQAKLNKFADSIQQTANDKVLVKFKEVPFVYLMVWVNELWKRHAIKVEQISIKPDEKTRGVVTADVFFTV